LNPLKTLLLTCKINDTIKFENEYFKIQTFIDTTSKRIVTFFNPVQKVKVNIKIDEKTKVVKTTLSKEVETKTKNYFQFGVITLICFLFVLILYKILKRWQE
jgi:hypothetical protein